MRTPAFYIFSLVILTSLWSCEEAYEPEIDPQAQRILVVEGDLRDSTLIRLSSSTPLSDNEVDPESGAVMEVEAETGGSIAFLDESSPGIYQAPLPLKAGENYRLHITTADGTSIVSDWVTAYPAQSIEDLYFEVSAGDVEIYLDAGMGDSTGFYRFTYEETWEYEAAFQSNFYWDGQDVVSRTQAQKIFRCYKTLSNSSIVLGSTANLNQDRLERQLIAEIDPMQSLRLNRVYSIVVEQQRISEEAFQFWRTLKNNTEGLGSIFDAQPSSLPTNYRVLNRDEPVIGYLGAGITTHKRLFITRNELPFTTYFDPYGDCGLIQYPNPLFPEPLVDIFGDGHVVPVNRIAPGSYWGTSRYCADCREQGGTTTKPSYWPF